MLGERLRQIRKENNLTKQELANALNVPKERIKLYETGEEIPSDFYLSSFVQYFNISKEELIELIK
ncbi:MAG TPA: helix-turn-helix transcriptional regulator [Sedimentibacter sp.]|jgi:transcriptional regulator with XRE-family HTH domain|nr:helix-turn-helix transcriptional regulator [Tissierellia bacterium]HAS90886.1 XRE family transcriptional regulator [Clostridiales bacterium]HOG62340.1 helix-turn-helix transcriptional regulator [Sedimentibacter sp.]HOT22018.1 helix-turn-helix transcriptional regulator [Sedimentibacter sp.]HPB79363.1 helix-turn-helix transcriptional regulator [Sedimentibacter sp.]